MLLWMIRDLVCGFGWEILGEGLVGGYLVEENVNIVYNDGVIFVNINSD